MPEKYSHRERLQIIFNGDRPDRFAASIWRHFFHVESSAEKMAEAMLAYQKKYDWDFMKINPRASFHTEDWGNCLEWSTDEFTKHIHTKYAVESIDDWDKIDILPTTAPVLANHLEAISLIKKQADPELPLLMTVFNPVGIAKRLVGDRSKFLAQLKDFPEKVIPAIERITQTFESFAAETRNAGADGLFYATLDMACEAAMPASQYLDNFKQQDLRILKATGNDALNLLHVCESHNYLKELSDYPVQLINWATADPTNHGLEESFEFIGDKTAVGGLDHLGWLLYGTVNEIKANMDRIKKSMDGKRFIFGPGCTIDARIPHQNIQAVRDNL